MVQHVCDKHSAARTRVGRRRLRLFCCACTRRIWHLLDERQRVLVEAAERAADGLLEREEWARREQEARTVWNRLRFSSYLPEQSAIVLAVVETTNLAGSAYSVPGWCALALARADSSERGGGGVPHDHVIWERIKREAWLRQGALMLDIFGNPFRSPAKRKFPAGVVGLAQACYDGDQSVYPILADALADLGEEQAAEHCREAGHVKGCHVVDWVLGKG
jgi:hypothetical protein